MIDFFNIPKSNGDCVVLLLFQLLQYPAHRLAEVAFLLFAALAFPIFGAICMSAAVLWWLAKSCGVWIVAALEAICLENKQLEDLERQYEAAREREAQMARDSDAPFMPV